MRRLSTGWTLAVCSGGLLLALPAQDIAARPSPGRLVILHTNDLHGQILPTRVVSRPGVERLEGGYAALDTYVRQARSRAAAQGVELW